MVTFVPTPNIENIEEKCVLLSQGIEEINRLIDVITMQNKWLVARIHHLEARVQELTKQEKNQPQQPPASAQQALMMYNPIIGPSGTHHYTHANGFNYAKTPTYRSMESEDISQ